MISGKSKSKHCAHRTTYTHKKQSADITSHLQLSELAADDDYSTSLDEDLPIDSPSSPEEGRKNLSRSSSSLSGGREALQEGAQYAGEGQTGMIHLCGRDEYNRTSGRCAVSGCKKKTAEGACGRAAQILQCASMESEIGTTGKMCERDQIRRQQEEDEEGSEEEECRPRNITLAEITVSEVMAIACEEMERAIHESPHEINLIIEISPLPDLRALLDPLFTSRKMIRFRCALSNVPVNELDKACASIAALVRVPRNGVTYIGGRYNAQIDQKIGRVIKGAPQNLFELPGLIMAELRIRIPLDWTLVQGLAPFRKLTSWKEFHLLASGVESVVRHMVQIERLGVFTPSGASIRMDFNTFRCDLPYAVYTTRPRMGVNGKICGYHVVSGINYLTERPVSEQFSLPPPYNFRQPAEHEEVE